MTWLPFALGLAAGFTLGALAIAHIHAGERAYRVSENDALRQERDLLRAEAEQLVRDRDIARWAASAWHDRAEGMSAGAVSWTLRGARRVRGQA
jgi:hypothetical protein